LIVRKINIKCNKQEEEERMEDIVAGPAGGLYSALTFGREDSRFESEMQPIIL
jgi:hypothetical protein